MSVYPIFLSRRRAARILTRPSQRWARNFPPRLTYVIGPPPEKHRINLGLGLMIHSPLWTCSLPARRRGSSFVARPKLIRSGESTVTATKRSLILGHDLPGRAPTRGPGSDVPTPTGPLFLRLRGPQLPRVSSATGEFRPPRTLRVEPKATRESRCPKPITVMPTKDLFQGCAWPPSAWDALRAEGITTLDRLRAVADQLEKLPGIGSRMAQTIREELARATPPGRRPSNTE
jgi:hypothetical protein